MTELKEMVKDLENIRKDFTKLKEYDKEVCKVFDESINALYEYINTNDKKL